MVEGSIEMLPGRFRNQCFNVKAPVSCISDKGGSGNHLNMPIKGMKNGEKQSGVLFNVAAVGTNK